MKHHLLLFVLASLQLGQIGLAAITQEGSLTVIVPAVIDEPVKLTLREVDLERVTHSQLLQVFVGSEREWHADKAAIAGRYSVTDGRLNFNPSFEFVAGQGYIIRARHRSKQKDVFHTFTPFTIQGATPKVNAKVTAVYPSGDVLPENVLRFYIHFSTPMKPHVAFDHIQLVDVAGNADDAAFMKFKQELWSEDRKRLTVLIDPGRIKRNVATNRRLGPALHKGQRYELVVKSGWPTAHKSEPFAGYSKSFAVTDALRELPSPDAWQIVAPSSGTRDALKIKFDRPFDHQSSRNIQVTSVSGQEICGESSMCHHETQWHFQPLEAWANKSVRIVVDSELEDVAGNNLRDLLDHSVEAETKRRSRIVIPVDLTVSTTLRPHFKTNDVALESLVPSWTAQSKFQFGK